MVHIDLEAFSGGQMFEETTMEEGEVGVGGLYKRTQTSAQTITAETRGTDATLTLQLGEKSDFRFNYPPRGRK